ncbi:glycosyl hydrolase 108 family protein [Novosphingobium sp.]|uniref:glycoside hydrolase family 108 protein n=1 Tax=Novosphingobium sp. TaxID=1874826 RepID=UPI0026221AC6|nr:glycosyl hydrolase 108 family protein [Novosphingobium sp.]
MTSTSPVTNAGVDEAIVVQGYSSRYAAAVRELLDIEGGHANDPLDRGGETKYGVSLRFLAAEGAFDEDGDGKADFDLDFDGDIDGADIRALTVGDAVYLYHRCFWQPLQSDTFTAPIGEMLFDQAVNGGALAARKLLQRAINNCILLMPASKTRVAMLKVDGAIGEKTRTAMREILHFNALAMPALVTAYREAVRERYRAIVRRFPAQKRYLRGWLARADRLGRA